MNTILICLAAFFSGAGISLLFEYYNLPPLIGILVAGSFGGLLAHTFL